MKLILAPLRGITNKSFRKIYHSHFPYFDRAVAPFVSPTASEKLGNGLFNDLLHCDNKELQAGGLTMPVEPQILLNNPAVLYPFLDKIYALGYRRINVNMGCPATVVVKKKKGAALLENPDLIDAVLEKISNDKRFEFSVKMRLGMTDKNRAQNILPLIEKHKPCEIIIHPRTAAMQYSGDVDLEYFAELLAQTKTPIIYNGDIFSFAKFKTINALFVAQISGIMLGRGVLANPFLSGEIKNAPIPDNPAEKIHEFVGDLYNEYKNIYFGEKPVLGKMKELWRYLRFSFEDSEKSVKKIFKSNTLSSYAHSVEELFATCEYKTIQTLGNIETE